MPHRRERVRRDAPPSTRRVVVTVMLVFGVLAIGTAVSSVAVGRSWLSTVVISGVFVVVGVLLAGGLWLGDLWGERRRRGVGGNRRTDRRGP